MAAKLKVFYPTLLAAGLAATANAAGRSEVEQLLPRAEQSLAEARQAGNAWTSTDKLLAEAREALAAGDTGRAEELASRALLTADEARQQPQREAEAWQARVPSL